MWVWMWVCVGGGVCGVCVCVLVFGFNRGYVSFCGTHCQTGYPPFLVRAVYSITGNTVC